MENAIVEEEEHTKIWKLQEIFKRFGIKLCIASKFSFNRYFSFA
jgi:hypothetical protein